jgi:hypothetical protein
MKNNEKHPVYNESKEEEKLFLLQIPSNLTLLVSCEYLFCLVNNLTTCNMSHHRLQEYYTGYSSCRKKCTACSKEANVTTVHILILHHVLICQFKFCTNKHLESFNMNGHTFALNLSVNK